MDTLPTDLRGALPPADGDSDSDTYFQVDKGIDRQTLLEVCTYVVAGWVGGVQLSSVGATDTPSHPFNSFVHPPTHPPMLLLHTQHTHTHPPPPPHPPTHTPHTTTHTGI